MLTQNGKLYTWGLANDGRLGLGDNIIGSEERNYRKFTAVPQRIMFSNSIHIDSVHASGCIAYAQVTNLKNDTTLTVMDQDTFVWGAFSHGVNMKR